MKQKLKACTSRSYLHVCNLSMLPPANINTGLSFAAVVTFSNNGGAKSHHADVVLHDAV
jgi:hypothetical protein